MANPVCFFDIEIGGQPAGRIEMTVRASRRRRAATRDARDERRRRSGRWVDSDRFVRHDYNNLAATE